LVARSVERRALFADFWQVAAWWARILPWMSTRSVVLALSLLAHCAWVAGEAAGELAAEAGSGIDRLVLARLEPLGIRPKVCSDEVFMRRVYLDVTGMLPTAGQARAFLEDPDQEHKRSRLIERLLESPEFPRYWSMKWGDILRIKAEFPVNLWPNAAQAYHRWVLASLADNKPYDQFARELLTSSGSNFRVGPVNFYRAIQDKSPQGIATAVALTLMGARAEKWPPQRFADMTVFFSQVGYKPTREWKEEVVFWDPFGNQAWDEYHAALAALAKPAPPPPPPAKPAPKPGTAPPTAKPDGQAPKPEIKPPAAPPAPPAAAPAKPATAAPAKPAAAPVAPQPAAKPGLASAAPVNAKPSAQPPPPAKPAPGTPAVASTPAAPPPLPPVRPVPKPPGEAVFPDGTRVVLSLDLDPRQVFADWLVRPANPWFTRNIANRMWAWLLGRGIVHEPDDLRDDNPPANPELLAFLEQELIGHRYDLKHLCRLILNSRTYQFESVAQFDTPAAEALFAGYPLRRLEAEVLIDAINRVTGASDLYTSPIPEPFTYIPEDMPATAIADGSISSPFLALFGRSARASGMENERANDLRPAQWLHLLNSSHIQRKLEQGPALKDLLASGRKAPEITEELYLTILSRFPTPEELRAVEAYGKPGQGKRREDWNDIAWALLNSTEFLFRH
jgi:hypothetical protein